MTDDLKNNLIDIGNLKLHYEVTGPLGAPWLTVAHSLATNMSMWESQLPVLSEHFRVLSFDARGHGGSDIPKDSSAMSDLVDDVLGLWDRLNIDCSHFVGLSMGGMTGIGVALKAPNRVQSLVACDCRLDAPRFFQDMWDQRIESVHLDGMQSILAQTMGSWFTPQRLDAGGDVIDNVSQMIVNTRAEGYIACAKALKGLDYKSLLATVAVPTLYVVGDQDGLHPSEMQELARLTPDAKFVILENAAHLANMEQPQIFNRSVLKFLLNNCDS
ncbi:MAG: alpha/beta fold hydrolase [Porticoccaceae bacterium]|jgi:3-oxoadipate enol-lactonase|nr:alpha/beta fold hydrolase [Porticoccaceae bacterium]MBT4211697.1 alpha/beta fold hydrolase [Porticoccaceae bacterium]MBT5103031.1 alpha/beta fold hydrolase [Porticoccaceae bacterium]MBT6421695.1 alpha/beta fold hydrolase [Porticoccaceae bacterium]MBT7963920.1 alpha/beta fold hydrolase [Porticoccaceae bacterium]